MENREKEKSFEGKLDECDIEIIWKWNYIFDSVEEVQDKEMELAQEIAELKVENEIAERMEEYNKVNVNELKKKEEELNYLEDKEAVLEDMEDEMYAAIMTN